MMAVLERLKAGHHVTEEHVFCAERLIGDCQAADKEGYASAHGIAGHHALRGPERRLAARRRVEDAQDVLGPDLAQVLRLVVVDNSTLKAAAEAMGIHEKAVLPMVRAGLQVLAGHYQRSVRF